eukprot:TRINITY_DN1556_c1_g1_i1.p1 TRINITY_DN1556_c1_g1~~TRINITY_DN1556_c1_g1_i1.p1  ORF type:complete len:359 (+),score=134.11 TRINITY_DN1556_c1_g1_i1:94-1077(+)
MALAAVPSEMRAVRVKGLFGCGPPFDCITVKTIRTPKPSSGHVLVRMNGSSVNPVDVDLLKDLGAIDGTLGSDLAGTVVECNGCTRLKVGDEVWADAAGEVGGGAYADYVVVTEKQTGLKPTNLNMTQAGSMPLVGMTSLQCLKKAGAPWDAKRNLTVVITSGSGGTGFIGVQLARVYGAGTIVTATTGADNIALVKSLGADVVTDFKKINIFDALANNSVDVVYDNYGAVGSADRAMPKMKDGSVYVLLPGGQKGALSKHPKPGVTQINFGLTKGGDHTDLDELKGLFEAGKIRPHVMQSFDLAHVSEAYSLSASGTVVGKVAVTA